MYISDTRETCKTCKSLGMLNVKKLIFYFEKLCPFITVLTLTALMRLTTCQLLVMLFVVDAYVANMLHVKICLAI